LEEISEAQRLSPPKIKNMASPGDDPMSEYLQELDACTRTSIFHDPPRRFILASRLLDWLRQKTPVHSDDRSRNIAHLLRYVYGGPEPKAGTFNALLDDVERHKHRCWLKVFVILLEMSRDGWFAKHIHLFVKEDIVDRTSPYLHRSELEKKMMRIPCCPPDQVVALADRFINLAQQLTTDDVFSVTHGRNLDCDKIVPITAKDPVNSGGQSRVFRVEVPLECIADDLINRVKRVPIADDYYEDGKVSLILQVYALLLSQLLTDTTQSKYLEFALKRIDHEEDWEREIEAHGALAPSSADGIVQCLGSWKVETSPGYYEYFLLMEFGWSDLDQYFHSYLPPCIPTDILNFWISLSGLVVALGRIHDIETSPGNRYFW
jgi:hypothetical protein